MATDSATETEICRCCLTSSENPHNIFELNINETQLSQCLLEICNTKVIEGDKLPKYICITCYDNLKLSYAFRLQVQKNNSFLISILKEDLIEECQQSDDNDIIECDINELNIIKEDYEISDLKYNDKSIVENSIENSENDYITEYVEYIDNLNLENKNFECKLCNRKFKYSKNLRFHERKHLQEGYLRCQYCTKRFYKNYDLRRHIQVEHIKIKEFTCTICKENFFTKPELNRHIKYHSDIKNFQCLQCSQKFYDKSTLDVHIRVVHLKEKNYICEFCNKKFSSNAKVRRHQNSQICNSIATKIISTINVGQHLVILDYDPNSNITNDEINKPQETLQENLLTEENIHEDNFTITTDQILQITDPIQKFLN